MRAIRKLTQQDGWKTQDSKTAKKMWRGTVHSQSYTTLFRHSAVLSVPAVLLRKLRIDDGLHALSVVL